MLCFNFFFFPPIGEFTVADPQNWVALFAFLATSLTASQLSARAKRRTKEAVDETARNRKALFPEPCLAAYRNDATHATAGGSADRPDLRFCQRRSLRPRQRRNLSRSIPKICRTSNPPCVIRRCDPSVIHDEASHRIVTPIRLGEEPIGSLAMCGASLSDAALQSLLNLVAIGMERARAQEAVNRAKVARQGDELKSTLLDAIAHEFKTPLTSIKAVTTDLLSEPAGQLQAAPARIDQHRGRGNRPFVQARDRRHSTGAHRRRHVSPQSRGPFSGLAGRGGSSPNEVSDRRAENHRGRRG